MYLKVISKFWEQNFPTNGNVSIKKLARPYDYFHRLDEYQKPVNNLKRGGFLKNLITAYLGDEEIERTKGINKLINIKDGEELIKIHLTSDAILLTCVFEKVLKVSIIEFDNNPLFCVSLRGCTWQCGLKYTAINLQTLQNDSTAGK